MARIRTTLLSKDRFGEKVPAFNYEGKGAMGTWFGLVTTIGFWSVLLMLVALKIARLVNGSNPLISSAVDLDYYGADDKVDIYESSMLGAFQVVDFNTKEAANDPNFF
jgi:hypothetical protein